MTRHQAKWLILYILIVLAMTAIPLALIFISVTKEVTITPRPIKSAPVVDTQQKIILQRSYDRALWFTIDSFTKNKAHYERSN